MGVRMWINLNPHKLLMGMYNVAARETIEQFLTVLSSYRLFIKKSKENEKSLRIVSQSPLCASLHSNVALVLQRH